MHTFDFEKLLIVNDLALIKNLLLQKNPCEPVSWNLHEAIEEVVEVAIAREICHSVVDGVICQGICKPRKDRLYIIVICNINNFDIRCLKI